MNRAEMRREWKEYRKSAPHRRGLKFKEFVLQTYGFELKKP